MLIDMRIGRLGTREHTGVNLYGSDWRFSTCDNGRLVHYGGRGPQLSQQLFSQLCGTAHSIIERMLDLELLLIRTIEAL